MKKLIKENKAFVMADIVVAIIIFSIFTGIVTTLMTKTYEQNLQIKVRSNAMTYAVKLLEKVDEKSFNEIVENPNCLLEGMPENNSSININVEVSDVPNISSEANNIMKIVNISVRFTFSQGTQYLNFSKLKIKEET